MSSCTRPPCYPLSFNESHLFRSNQSLHMLMLQFFALLFVSGLSLFLVLTLPSLILVIQMDVFRTGCDHNGPISAHDSPQ